MISYKKLLGCYNTQSPIWNFGEKTMPFWITCVSDYLVYWMFYSSCQLFMWKLIVYFASPKLRLFWYMLSIVTKLLERKSWDETCIFLGYEKRRGREDKTVNLAGILFLVYIELGSYILLYSITKMSPGKWKPLFAHVFFAEQVTLEHFTLQKTKVNDDDELFLRYCCPTKGV